MTSITFTCSKRSYDSGYLDITIKREPFPITIHMQTVHTWGHTYGLYNYEAFKNSTGERSIHLEKNLYIWRTKEMTYFITPNDKTFFVYHGSPSGVYVQLTEEEANKILEIVHQFPNLPARG
jgi:hypothetical protein